MLHPTVPRTHDPYSDGVRHFRAKYTLHYTWAIRVEAQLSLKAALLKGSRDLASRVPNTFIKLYRGILSSKFTYRE